MTNTIVKIFVGGIIGLFIGVYDYPIKTYFAGDSLCVRTAKRQAGSSLVRVPRNRDLRVVDQAADNKLFVKWNKSDAKGKQIPNQEWLEGSSKKGLITLWAEDDNGDNFEEALLVEVSNIFGSYRYIESVYCR